MKAKRTKPDSFGLMIDTMCNALGGLVLIAVVIAIVGASISPSENALERLEERIAMTERRAETFVQERLYLEEREAENNDLTDAEASIDAAAFERLRKEVEERRLENRRLERDLTVKQDAVRQLQYEDPGELVVEVTARAAAFQEEMRELEKGILEKEQEAQRLKEVGVREVTLPRERAYSRYDHIIVRNGQLYPIYAERIKEGNPPSAYFEVLESSSHTIRFKPIKGKGLQIGSALMREFIRDIGNMRGVCILGFYPDSYDLFDDLYALLEENDIPYGVIFYNNLSHIGFTAIGGLEQRGF